MKDDFTGTWLLKNGQQVTIEHYNGYIGRTTEGQVIFFNAEGNAISQGPAFDLKLRIQLEEGCYPPRVLNKITDPE